MFDWELVPIQMVRQREALSEVKEELKGLGGKLDQMVESLLASRA